MSSLGAVIDPSVFRQLKLR